VFAGNGTYTWLFAALAAIECTVPAEWPGGVGGAVAGTGGSVGTSWVRTLDTDAMTPNTGPTGSFPAVT
jgi:hypothetical protein